MYQRDIYNKGAKLSNVYSKGHRPMQDQYNMAKYPQHHSQGPYNVQNQHSSHGWHMQSLGPPQPVHSQYSYPSSHRVLLESPGTSQQDQSQYHYHSSHEVPFQAPVLPQQGWSQDDRQYSAQNQYQSQQQDYWDISRYRGGPSSGGEPSAWSNYGASQSDSYPYHQGTKMMAYGYSATNSLSVEMESVDDQLKKSICSVLDSVSKHTINDIIWAVKNAGVKSYSDLRFVKEEDLMYILEPNQRQKLIDAWSKQILFLGILPNNRNINWKKWNKAKQLLLLQVYAKYKKGFSYPDATRNEIWKKIADEVEIKSSMSCDEIECQDLIEVLRCRYNKNKDGTLIGSKMITFLNQAKYAFEDTENPVDFFINVPKLEKIKGYKPVNRMLLKAYAKYKSGFLQKNVDEQIIWRKIADELRRINHFVNWDEVECRNKVNELKCEYENIKSKLSNRKLAKYCDFARRIFEKTNQGMKLKKKKLIQPKDKTYKLKLLQVYGKHKTESTSPNHEKQEVWNKIAKEMRENLLYNCNASLCQFDLIKLMQQYENFKKNSKKREDNTIVDSLFTEAQKAFETTQNIDNSGANCSNLDCDPPNSDPPSPQCKQPVYKTAFTVKVTHLSKLTKFSELLKLFKPFGHISRINLARNGRKRCRGFGFITFYKQEDALQAIRTLNGCKNKDTILNVVSWPQNKSDKKKQDTDVFSLIMPADNSITTGTQFECSGAGKKLEDSKIITPDEVANYLFAENCKWKKVRVLMLQAYSKYKTELSCPDVKEESVWKKIADEIKANASSDWTELECQNKIDELRQEYEKSKSNPSTKCTQNMLIFKLTKKAFETTEKQEAVSSSQTRTIKEET